ncbi:MAG: hypothetical protein JRH18_10060 [Deltaproteobacteria bacterium]|nr:hypothetical protein [Deltaproteobacteria bacterium]MBW1963216.1 hypothetical protein [Deltaproteobacteria bacterium]MBW1993850.1 hypothetical protein [Deltaproteobacteria bacterium]MBW2151999.1 hypothetical protein [Deltaproteobacteria bacterium]
MLKTAKQVMVFFLIMNILIFSVCTPVLAQQRYDESGRTGEKMIADAVLLRPAGFLGTALGSAVFIISLPFSLLGKNHREAFDKMIKEPARYTFVRPLGDF